MKRGFEKSCFHSFAAYKGNYKVSGFTLIELLVVVLIIGILAAIALPQYTRAVERARAAEAVQWLSSAKKAVSLYLLNNDLPAGTTVIDLLNSGVLDIDLKAGLPSKYYRYGVICSKEGCSIYTTYFPTHIPLMGFRLDTTDGKTWTGDISLNSDKTANSLYPLFEPLADSWTVYGAIE